ncbi:hypothetical protein MLD38_027370 [Melastoma candidum]|uniref:Uncharacterized protein n=1 Tax=Melastoma candidum TaxID=119954 RepID=A0ACB9P4T2_9MYRT|nr:hypothetical protein MLD38_027370 [Melastoma candidum]
MESKEGNKDPAAAVKSSESISLLQERFRQLQRLKEMRVEKDPLRFVNKVASHKVSGHPRLDFSSKYPISHERKLYPNRITSYSLPPLLTSLERNVAADELRLWHPGNARPASPPSLIDLVGSDHDVDTSLRL